MTPTKRDNFTRTTALKILKSVKQGVTALATGIEIGTVREDAEAVNSILALATEEKHTQGWDYFSRGMPICLFLR